MRNPDKDANGGATALPKLCTCRYSYACTPTTAPATRISGSSCINICKWLAWPFFATRMVLKAITVVVNGFAKMSEYWYFLPNHFIRRSWTLKTAIVLQKRSQKTFQRLWNAIRNNIANYLQTGRSDWVFGECRWWSVLFWLQLLFWLCPSNYNYSNIKCLWPNIYII